MSPAFQPMIWLHLPWFLLRFSIVSAQLASAKVGLRPLFPEQRLAVAVALDAHVDGAEGGRASSGVLSVSRLRERTHLRKFSHRA